MKLQHVACGAVALSAWAALSAHAVVTDTSVPEPMPAVDAGSPVARMGQAPSAAGTAPSVAQTSLALASAQASVASQWTDRLIIKYRSPISASATTDPSTTSNADQNAATGSVAPAALRMALGPRGVDARRLRSLHSGAQLFQLSRRMVAAELAAVMQTLVAADSNIEYVEADRLMYPAYTPNDVHYPKQWYLFDPVAGVRAPAAWDRTLGTGITVAVIDTGVRPHVDLLPNLLPGYDFITDLKFANDGNGRDADASDPGDATTAGECGSGSRSANSSWHGTHVAGIVAAVSGNGLGVSGVAPQARVLPVRVMGKCGGYTSDIADGIAWSAGASLPGVPRNLYPAKVLNLSLGVISLGCGSTMQSAVNTARASGAAVVAAAGNSSTNALLFSPANCSGVIAVAATGPTGGRASYSNSGSVVSLAAPGGDGQSGIVSTVNTGTVGPGADAYAAYKGTSMAAPVVAGVAALMLSVRPSLTPDALARMLKASASAFPVACSGCGTGIVNASAAVEAALNGTIDPPPPGPKLLKETEPNNTLANAQIITDGRALVSASVGSTNDVDNFRVTVGAGKTLVVRAQPKNATALKVTSYIGVLPWLSATGSQGKAVTLSVPNISWVPLAVVVRVERTSGTAGEYQLSIEQ